MNNTKPIAYRRIIECWLSQNNKLYGMDFFKNFTEKCVNYVNSSIQGKIHIVKFPGLNNQPGGITSLVSVGSSFIGIHTWPEFNYFCIEASLCEKDSVTGKTINLDGLEKALLEDFQDYKEYKIYNIQI